MRITQKGQVTIPAEIRERLGLLPDTEVDFRIEDGHVVLEKAAEPGGRGKGIVARLQGRADTELSTDEILSLTRERD
jgi:AbrB family looped-hinge helix DNA binding protein